MKYPQVSCTTRTGAEQEIGQKELGSLDTSQSFSCQSDYRMNFAPLFKEKKLAGQLNFSNKCCGCLLYIWLFT